MLAEQAQRYVPGQLCAAAHGTLRESAEKLTGPGWAELYASLDAADLPRPVRERLRPILNRARTLATMEAMLSGLSGVCAAWEEAQKYPPKVLRRVEYDVHRSARSRRVRVVRRCVGPPDDRAA